MSKEDFKSKIALRPVIIILLVVGCCGLVACLVLGFWGVTRIAGINGLIAPPPGEGAKAENGYQVCGPVIKALSEYHVAEGEYPSTLESLRPAYLADVPSEVNGFPILYRTTQDSYSLEFRYTGPGMNVCTYTPENDWYCYGYY
jgi:hypothetical protein